MKEEICRKWKIFRSIKMIVGACDGRKRVRAPGRPVSASASASLGVPGMDEVLLHPTDGFKTSKGFLVI